MLNKPVTVLIQNVSDQCIPNLVAAKTFQPESIVWVCTQEKKDVLERLQQSTQIITHKQSVWWVDARNSEAMNQSLLAGFKKLNTQGSVIYHLTCGTKSMALQGLMQLAVYKQHYHVDVCGLVMDPHSQHFDVVFPVAQNNIHACNMLNFKDVLSVHGSCRKAKSGRDMQSLKKVYEPLNQLRHLHTALMRDLKGRRICSKDEAANGYFLWGDDTLPKNVITGLELAQQAGVIENLKIDGGYFTFNPIQTMDPIAYIRNMWMEDWVGAVLASHDDGKWLGGYSSVKVEIKSPDDYQEFDFLGVRNNHLVYWSCKNTTEVKAQQLFEIDALRDEVGGRDFHVAGLVHTAKVETGLKMKAKRLGLHLLRVTDADAEIKLLQISHT